MATCTMDTPCHDPEFHMPQPDRKAPSDQPLSGTCTRAHRGEICRQPARKSHFPRPRRAGGSRDWWWSDSLIRVDTRPFTRTENFFLQWARWAIKGTEMAASQFHPILSIKLFYPFPKRHSSKIWHLFLLYTTFHGQPHTNRYQPINPSQQSSLDKKTFLSSSDAKSLSVKRAGIA